MKATPELLELALRGIGIGTNIETCSKILTTVRLLEVKGDAMDLKDFAAIEAFYTEKIEPQSLDLSNLEVNDLIEFVNGESYVVNKLSTVEYIDTKQVLSMVSFHNHEYGYFYSNGKCDLISLLFGKEGDINVSLSDYDIMKITKPTKPQ